jgi:hypothetical protein
MAEMVISAYREALARRERDAPTSPRGAGADAHRVKEA